MEEIGAVLELLDERSRHIIEARFGFFGPPQTLQRLGRKYSITRERIRQLEFRAIGKLRRILTRRIKSEARAA